MYVEACACAQMPCVGIFSIKRAGHVDRYSISMAPTQTPTFFCGQIQLALQAESTCLCTGLPFLIFRRLVKHS